MATWFAGLNTAAQGAGGWGNLMKGAGAALNFGSALGTIFGGKGKQSKKAARYAREAAMQDARAEIVNGEIQARQDLMNAYAANRDAARTEATAKEEAAHIARQGRANRGKQLAAAAATGAQIAVPEMDIVAEDMMDIELAVTRTIFNGHLQSQSFRDQSQDYLASGEAARKTAHQRAKARLAEGEARAWQIKQERKQEVMGGIGDLLKGGAGLYGIFAGMSGKQVTATSGNPLAGLKNLFGSKQDYGSPRGSEFWQPAQNYGSPRPSESYYSSDNYNLDF